MDLSDNRIEYTVSVLLEERGEEQQEKSTAAAILEFLGAPICQKSPLRFLSDTTLQRMMEARESDSSDLLFAHLLFVDESRQPESIKAFLEFKEEVKQQQGKMRYFSKNLKRNALLWTSFPRLRNIEFRMHECHAEPEYTFVFEGRDRTLETDCAWFKSKQFLDTRVTLLYD